MLLAYLDESGDEDVYSMSALMIKDTDAIGLGLALDEVVKYASQTYDSVWPETELHAYDLAWGLKEWKSLHGNVPGCVDIYSRAIDAIAKFDVKIASRGVDLAGLKQRYDGGADPHSVTLTFALERIDIQAAEQETVALVIADEVGRRQPAYRRRFREYQRSGTWGWKSRVLEHLVDTIHFAPSNSSRLIQAADMVSYTRHQKDRKTGQKRAREFYMEQWEKLEPKVTEDSCWDPVPKEVNPFV